MLMTLIFMTHNATYGSRITHEGVIHVALNVKQIYMLMNVGIKTPLLGGSTLNKY